MNRHGDNGTSDEIPSSNDLPVACLYSAANLVGQKTQVGAIYGALIVLTKVPTRCYMLLTKESLVRDVNGIIVGLQEGPYVVMTFIW